MEVGKLILGMLLAGFVGYVIGSSSVDTYKEDFEIATGQCEIVRDDYKTALRRADRNIEEANSNFSEARDYAWSNYEDMGYALENLEDVEVVDDPETSCI